MDRRRFFQLAGVACAAGAATLTARSVAGRTHFEDETIYGSDFGPAVKGLTFTRCHFAEPMKCRLVAQCEFDNCTYDDVIVKSFKGEDLWMINCVWKFPPDCDARWFIAKEWQ
jgi:hypothetical protein